MNERTVLYSHGFGVRRDDRGLFLDIAAALPDAEHVMFDYNQFDEESNTLTTSPLHEQVSLLEEQLSRIDAARTVDIVAHSQGCVVAALVQPSNVRNIICIAPPEHLSSDEMLQVFGSREGGVINLEGESRVPRRDGSTTIIPEAYWQSIRDLDVIGLYNRLARLAKVRLLIATDDEVLGSTTFDGLDETIKLQRLPGNHDFTGEHRAFLVNRIKEVLG